MKFSVLAVINQAWDAPERYQEVIESVQECEALGFDCFWFTEHHLEEYGRPCPELLASHALAVTERIDIGTGVICVPWHHPLDVAEQAATLDNLGKGRFRFGIGRGTQAHEFDAYGIPREDARGRFEESYEIIRGLWENETFSYDGKFWSLPEVRFVPTPYTRPHPPMWQPAVAEAAIREIVDRGINGLIGSNLTPYPVLKDRYFDVWHDAKEQSGQAHLQMAHMEIFHIAETDEKAYAEAKPAVEWYLRKLGALWAGPSKKVAAPPNPAFAEFLDRLKNLSYEEVCSDLAIIGGPETAIEKVRFFEECGVDELILFAGMGPQMTSELLRSSLTHFAEHVMPAFKEVTKPAV